MVFVAMSPSVFLGTGLGPFWETGGYLSSYNRPGHPEIIPSVPQMTLGSQRTHSPVLKKNTGHPKIIPSVSKMTLGQPNRHIPQSYKRHWASEKTVLPIQKTIIGHQKDTLPITKDL